jgi:cardiolipin synthase (CMP-forming)
MGHLEAGHHETDAGRAEHGALRVAHRVRHGHEVRGQLGIEIGPVVYFDDRHDERVTRRERAHVEERNGLVVAQQEAPRYLSVDDAAEDRRHGRASYAGAMATRRGVLTLPNLVTFVRLCCIPLFLVLLFGADDRAGAAYLLGALGATDWVDGYLARRLGQVSEVGKILDPTADRLLFLVGILAMLIDRSVPVWFGVLALTREATVAIAALTLGALGARRVDVTWLGKCATFTLMLAFPLFLAGHADLSWSPVAEALAWVVGVPGLVLSYYAAWQYVPLARRALSDGRAGARPSPTIR